MEDPPPNVTFTPLRYVPLWLRVPIAIFIGHKFVTVGSKYTLWQHFGKWQYWLALAVSAGVALVMVEYIHRLTVYLDRKFDWHRRFKARLWRQLLFCLLVPGAFTFLIFMLYFSAGGVPERIWGYFRYEFQFACLLYLVMNVCYWGMNDAVYRSQKAGAGTLGFIASAFGYRLRRDGGLEEPKLMVKHGYETVPVRISGIAWVHNTHDRGEVHLKNGSVFRQDEPLHKLITQFPYPRFCKVNRWYILNRDVVKEVHYWLNKRKGLLIILDAPYHLKIKVSPQQADEVKKWAGELLRVQS